MYSNILKALESQNISKNQFCKDINISKAYINKVFNGSTPMSERLFASILALPYLSDKVKEEITKTRFESKHGENCELVMYFNEVAKGFENSLIPKDIKETELPCESLIISERNRIVSLAYSLAKYSVKSGSALCSNHTYAQKDIDDALYTAFYERDEAQSDTNFVHLIEKPHIFNKSYINFIWSALRYGTICIAPLATDEVITSSLMPYVMVCDKYALMWNEECNRAHFICENAFSNAIRDNFISLKEKSSPFSVICVDEAKIMTKEVSDPFQVSAESPVVVSSVPGSCVEELEFDTLAEVVRKDLPEKTANFLIHSYLNYHHFQSESIKKHYIISDSLLSFAKTGEYASISHRYINDFSAKLREKTIDKLKDAFKEDKNYIIDSEKIFFPPFVQIDYYQSSARIHIDSVYRKFHVFNACVIINHADNIDSKKFFNALLDYQTNPDTLMTAAQIDYTLENLKLLCDN
ncbi:MAG: helix-turn-helix domain-containing protein [Acutalibacteraceae bacterium]